MMQPKLKHAIASTVIGLGCIGVASNPVQAAQFNLSFSGSGVDASAILTTTDLDPTTNTYTITDVSGTLNGQPIAIYPFSAGVPQGNGVYFTPTGVNGRFIEYNNLLFSSDPFFNFSGLAFTVGTGTEPANIYYESGYQYLSPEYLTNPATSNIPVSVSVSPVPEPQTVVATLLVGGIGLLMKRKQFAGS